MKPIDDLTDMLAEEVLGDMAETFFGSRVEIDQKMELFEEYKKELRKKGEEVSSRAGFLNSLLIDKKSAVEFYTMLGVETDTLADKRGFNKDALPEKIPGALTAKGEFTKLVLFGYASLRESCLDYLRGRHTNGLAKHPDEKAPVTYRMLKHMSAMINEKIEKVNERSTVCTLQYTRQFNPETIEKEKITGGGFAENGCDKLDKNLKFKPIDFDSLGIESYPELPSPETVKKEITRFAKGLFSKKTSETKKAISEIKYRM